MSNTWLLLALAISVTCLFAKVMADYDHAVKGSRFESYPRNGNPYLFQSLDHHRRLDETP
jgi:hypothetical protein